MIRKPVRAADGRTGMMVPRLPGVAPNWPMSSVLSDAEAWESRLSQGVQRARLCYGFTQHSLGLKAISDTI